MQFLMKQDQARLMHLVLHKDNSTNYIKPGPLRLRIDAACCLQPVRIFCYEWGITHINTWMET